MADKIGSAFDPVFFTEFKEALSNLAQLKEGILEANKNVITVTSGDGGRTLVDLNGNLLKVKESTNQVKVAFDSYEVSLERVAEMKAKYNGTTDTLVGLSKKVAQAKKEEEQAILATAKADTEASKQFLNNKKAEREAAQTLYIERRRQIMEERELNRLIREEEKQRETERQAQALKTAEADKIAAQAAKDRALVTAQSHAEMTGTNVASAANADGTVVNAGEAAEARVVAEAERDLAGARRVETVAVAQETVVEEENLTVKELLIRQYAVTKKALADVTLELKQNEQAFIEGSVTAGEYEAKMLALTEQQLLIKKELAQTNVQLKEQGLSYDSSVGKAGKFESMLQRMGLRMIANLVIFQGAIEVLTAIGDQFTRISDRINYQQKTMSDIAEKSANNFSQEAVELDLMKKRFEETTSSMADKEEIVKQLNEKFGNQIDKINGISDAEKFFRDKTPEMIKALELRAKAAGALSVAQEAFAKQIKIDADPKNALTTFDKGLSLITGATSGTAGSINYETQVYATERKAQQNIYDYAAKIFADLNNQADAIDNKIGVDTSGKAGKEKRGPKDKMDADGTSERLAALKEQNQNRIAEEQSANEKLAALYKQAADDENGTVETRLQAYEEYERAKIQLALVSNAKETADEEAKLQTLDDKEKQYNAGKLKLSAYQLETLHLQQKNASDKLKLLNTNTQDEIDQIVAKGEEDRKKIRENERLQDVEFEKQALETIKASYTAEYEAEKAALGKHSLSKRQYREELQKLDDKYAGKILDEQIDQISELIQKDKLEGTATKELQVILDKLLETRAKLGKHGGSDNAFGISKDDLKVIKDASDLANNLLSDYQNLEQAQSEKRQKAIDKDIEGINKRRDSQIEAYKTSTQYAIDTEQQRAQKIADINARAQADEDAANEKKKAEQRKEAERDKAIKLAKAIIAGALFVLESSSIPEAILRGITVAAEVATIAATPIPEFYKGTKNAPEGPARVGERGAELIIPKQGKPWIADKEMIAWLGKGTEVKTHTETMELMKHFAIGMPMLRTKNGKEYAMDEIMQDTAQQIVTAIERKRFPTSYSKPAWYNEFYYQNAKK
jgi:hypothetical protein